MLVSAGLGAEAATNRVSADRGGAATAHWNLPDASRAAAIGTDTRRHQRSGHPVLERALAVS